MESDKQHNQETSSINWIAHTIRHSDEDILKHSLSWNSHAERIKEADLNKHEI